MVKGLDVFRDYFRHYTDHYILIGGTACDLAFQEAGMTFRATKDLDMSNLKSRGETIDNRDIKKHRNDALRLSLLLAQDARIFIPTPIQADIKEFITRMPDENPDIKSLRLHNLSLQRILKTLAIVYGLE